jgi:hypothetical protein
LEPPAMAAILGVILKLRPCNRPWRAVR